MAERINSILLRANTALFAQKMCQIINDTTQKSFTVQAKSLHKSTFSHPCGFISIVHFSGKVQGDYIIAMTEETAASICDLPMDCTENPQMLSKKRTFYGGTLAEIVNIAIGKCITELEKKFGPLTITSPLKIFGEIEYPKAVSGNVFIHGDCGTILCSLAINMTSIKSVKNTK